MAMSYQPRGSYQTALVSRYIELLNHDLATTALTMTFIDLIREWGFLQHLKTQITKSPALPSSDLALSPPKSLEAASRHVSLAYIFDYLPVAVLLRLVILVLSPPAK